MSNDKSSHAAGLPETKTQLQSISPFGDLWKDILLGAHRTAKENMQATPPHAYGLDPFNTFSAEAAEEYFPTRNSFGPVKKAPTSKAEPSVIQAKQENSMQMPLPIPQHTDTFDRVAQGLDPRVERTAKAAGVVGVSAIVTAPIANSMILKMKCKEKTYPNILKGLSWEQAEKGFALHAARRIVAAVCVGVAGVAVDEMEVALHRNEVHGPLKETLKVATKIAASSGIETVLTAYMETKEKRAMLGLKNVKPCTQALMWESLKLLATRNTGGPLAVCIAKAFAEKGLSPTEGAAIGGTISTLISAPCQNILTDLHSIEKPQTSAKGIFKETPWKDLYKGSVARFLLTFGFAVAFIIVDELEKVRKGPEKASEGRGR